MRPLGTCGGRDDETGDEKNDQFACHSLCTPGGAGRFPGAPAADLPRRGTRIAGPAVHRPISAGPIVRRSAGSRVELYGETGARVAQVSIRYAGPRGCERIASATLARATHRRSLSAARIRRPFGYFVATVPGTVRRVWADARSGSGHLLGSADFSKPLADGRPTTVFLERARP